MEGVEGIVDRRRCARAMLVVQLRERRIKQPKLNLVTVGRDSSFPYYEARYPSEYVILHATMNIEARCVNIEARCEDG